MRIEDPDQVSVPPDGQTSAGQPAWREDFPIDWPKDEYRSRRDFTKLLGLTSLAFVAGQIWIVLLSLTKQSENPAPGLEIVAAENLPVGGTKLFYYPTRIDPCLLVRLSREEFVAFGQKCTHLSCPVIPRVKEGRFFCPCHSGSFDIRSGYPVAGPPRRPLPRVLLEIRNGRVFATGLEGKEVV
jgi:Rieske Fe-S protein